MLSTTVLLTQGNFLSLELGHQCHQHSWRIHLNACDEATLLMGSYWWFTPALKFPGNEMLTHSIRIAEEEETTPEPASAETHPHNCWWPSGRDWWPDRCCAGIVAFAHMQQPEQGWIIHIRPGQLSSGHHFKGWWHMYKTGAVGASEGYKVQQQQPKQMICWIIWPVSRAACLLLGLHSLFGLKYHIYMLILGEISVEKISMLSSLGKSFFSCLGDFFPMSRGKTFISGLNMRMEKEIDWKDKIWRQKCQAW